MGRQFATYFLLEADVTFDEAKASLKKTALKKELPIPQATIKGETIKGHVFYDSKPLGEAQWYTTIRTISGKNIRVQALRSQHSAVILFEYKARRWLVCFGGGHSHVSELHYERRFGRILLSNAALKSGSILGFAARTFGRNPRSRRESTATPGPLERLEFFREANRLASLKAQIEIGDDKFTLVGGDSFRFFQADDLKGFTKVFTQLLAWWDGGKDKNKAVALKDPFIAVTEPALLKGLEADYEKALKNAPDSCFSISLLPETGWNAHRFSITLNRKELVAVTGLDVGFILHSARPHFKEETDHGKLKLHWTYEDDTEASLPLRYVLSYEQPQKAGTGEVYVRDDTKWWSFSTEWVKLAEARYEEALKAMKGASEEIAKSLPILTRAHIPKVKGKQLAEDHWLNEAKMKNKGAEKLHIVGVIKPGSSKSGFELADLYLPEAIYLHAKVGCGLDQVDKVCNQAEEAALMMSTPDFRKEVFDELTKLKLSPKFWPNSPDTVFAIVLIARKQGLSSRAKDRIARFHETIVSRGYQPAFVWVDDKP